MFVTFAKVRLWLFDEVIKGNVHEKKNFDIIERDDEEEFGSNDAGMEMYWFCEFKGWVSELCSGYLFMFIFVINASF